MKWIEARNTVCIDWNGVLDTYVGFTGIPYPPREGAKQFLQRLKEIGFIVIILTSSNAHVVRNWFVKYDMVKYVDQIVNKKVPAIVYLDDRGITFTGDYNLALKQILSFRAWWEDSEHIETPIRTKSHEPTIY